MTIKDRINTLWGNKRHHDYSETPQIPKNIMVELSNACNHACIFCANPHMQRKISRINSDLLERIMTEAADLACEEIGFYTTGEPFVHKNLKYFTSKAHDLGFRYIYISTNGALATPEKMQEIVDAGMNSIKFSINAGTRESYRRIHGRDDWDKVMTNLRFLSEYRKTLEQGLYLSVSFIVTKQTEHEEKIYRELFTPLVDEVYIQPCGSQAGNMSGAQQLLSVGEAQGQGDGGICPLPFARFHVTCEGYLTLCCTDYQNYLAVADLNEMSLNEAWHCPEFVAIRKRHISGDLKGTLCGNCWLNRMDPIEPLDKKLGSVIDFTKLYDEQKARIATWTSDT